MSEEHEPEHLEDPERVIDEIAARLSGMHDSLVDAATQVGYVRDSFKAIRPIWSQLANISTSDPYTRQVYASGVKSLLAFRDEIRSQQGMIAHLPGIVQTMVSSGSTLINATGTTASFVPSLTKISLPPAYPSPSLVQHESYAERLSKIDSALGSTYREIWQILYGTSADPERGALYLLRQAFDHLFDKLAPDDEVRKSGHWKQKGGDKPNQVTREERIKYAAHTHVKDGARARTLSASAKHMLDVYQGLNRAHERGELNPLTARQALAEMRSILEDWVNAIQV